ncbi:hypothetical protein K2173_010325 [Erythroxylum novogranatense]|uniref:Hydroxyproline-rich glycoprotein family protein n=1 Tax=Erythroxylum novogranatense TaxID=1862640 RepID=A0AAV8TDL4_9ROSI|nr:hypothetical protein K2173_010325 [Erythroxylum novogranatense]
MRGVNGESNTLETINAAATAIASAENRATQARVEKRRWGSCWSVYSCFGYHRHRKRIGHAVLGPETSSSGNNVQAENSTQATVTLLPFVAPPSSPVSFLQSEPPSGIQSPAGLLSISANMYSPSGPASIFAIGPYAHETQLVSPPAFSTFTTEPSTAPFTPPPESVHLTTPSSPEVPFAQLLDPYLRGGEVGLRFPLGNYEFQSYQLYPGSPVGHLISPRSGISGSGTSSPLPDSEFTAGGPHFIKFQLGDPPQLLNLDKLPTHEGALCQGSGILNPNAARPCNFLLDHQSPDVASHPQFENKPGSNQLVNHRVSFELNAEDLLRSVEQKPARFVKVLSTSQESGSPGQKGVTSNQLENDCKCRVGETSYDAPETAPVDGEKTQGHKKHQSITLGSIKEFNFDNGNGGDSLRTEIESDWWANGNVAGNDDTDAKNWSFFPMIQSDVR